MVLIPKAAVSERENKVGWLEPLTPRSSSNPAVTYKGSIYRMHHVHASNAADRHQKVTLQFAIKHIRYMYVLLFNV